MSGEFEIQHCLFLTIGPDHFTRLPFLVVSKNPLKLLVWGGKREREREREIERERE